MTRSFFWAIALLLALGPMAIAQKQIEVVDQTWFGYFNQARLSNRSGLWIDLQYRLTGNFVNERALSLGRIGYIYYLSDPIRLTAGYAYAIQHSGTNLPDIPEHRLWQQVQWIDKKNGFDLTHRFRIEERYRRKVASGELIDDYNFNWRLRYSFALTLPLVGKQVVAKTPFLFFNNEILINAGKSIINNYFDQERLFLSLGYQVTSQTNVQAGYMYIFQQLPTANQYMQTNAIRLSLFHNLDLRKKD
jgi:uncharacterized protein DUF2490